MLLLISSPYWPFAVLILGIAAVVLMITVVRLHAFIALMVAAILVGLISTDLPDIGRSWIVTAVELPMTEFGSMAGKIAWVIALAAIIGTAMMESGAADRIVQGLINSLGEKRVGIALMMSGLILSIPVFFDTVFFLLIPLARSLGLRTGKHYVLYVTAMAGGAAISHSLVPPTPGPLIMAEALEIDLGITILAGLAASLIPALAVMWFANRVDKQLELPVKDVGEHPVPESSQLASDLPPLGISVLPILMPVVLISLVSVLNLTAAGVPPLIDFLGNKNMAMSVGTIIALWLWARQRGLKMGDITLAIGDGLQIAGVIILITSAGGAFGAMIKHSGIGEAIQYATADFDINYIVLAWIIAAVMKIAQGSGTVSMITTASIMAGILTGADPLGYPPILILLSIGFGSLTISWMNDSGFWVVAKLSGFSQKETLKTWTKLLVVISVVGFIELLILSIFL